MASDLDGTLLDDEKLISPENKAAIRRFQAAGNIFTFATGRGITMARPYAQELGLDVPVILFNGPMIYDFKDERVIWQQTITGNVREKIKHILRENPHVGCEILIGENVYVTQLNDVERWHLGIGRVTPIFAEVDDVPDGWLKVLFALQPEAMPEFIKFVDAAFEGQGNLVQSDKIFYELMPDGVTKGTSLKKLARILGGCGMKTAAIGDNYNDIDMLRAADFSFAAGNALDDVKSAAQKVVSDNNNSVVRDAVEYLDNLALSHKR